MVQRVASESFPVELIQFSIALALFISTPVWMRCCSAEGLSPLALNLPVESHCEIKISCSRTSYGDLGQVSNLEATRSNYWTSTH